MSSAVNATFVWVRQMAMRTWRLRRHPSWRTHQSIYKDHQRSQSRVLQRNKHSGMPCLNLNPTHLGHSALRYAVHGRRLRSKGPNEAAQRWQGKLSLRQSGARPGCRIRVQPSAGSPQDSARTLSEHGVSSASHLDEEVRPMLRWSYGASLAIFSIRRVCRHVQHV